MADLRNDQAKEIFAQIMDHEREIADQREMIKACYDTLKAQGWDASVARAMVSRMKKEREAVLEKDAAIRMGERSLGMDVAD